MIGPLVVVLAMMALLATPSLGAAAVPAKAADSFVESIGVNLHLGNTETPYYQRYDEMKSALEELGVHHVRGVLYAGSPALYAEIRDLASQGIRSTLIMGDPGNGSAGLEELTSAVKTELGGSVDAVEGPNEYSTSGDPDWKAHLIAYQQQLYAEIKADPALAALPVIGPSIVHGDQSELGQISDYLDYGNIHSYPQGSPPDKLGSFIKRAELNSGSKPIIATETGYHTALAWKGEHPPVSEEAMATYMPRLFLEYFRWGIARTFSYELIDERPDPDLADREDHFGLLRNDLSEKPAFVALANTIQILKDPGPSFAAGSLRYTLSEGGAEIQGPESTELHKVLLQKRNGSFYLALWRTSSVWDQVEQEPLVAATKPVTVTVEPGLKTAAEYLPNSSPDPIWALTNPADPPTVNVGPRVVILKLTPEENTPQSLPAAAISANVEPAPPAPPTVSPVPRCLVPALRGRTVKAARKRLRGAGCEIGALTRIAGSAGKPAKVVGQSPRPGAKRGSGARVRLTLK